MIATRSAKPRAAHSGWARWAAETAASTSSPLAGVSVASTRSRSPGAGTEIDAAPARGWPSTIETSVAGLARTASTAASKRSLAASSASVVET